jgi:hypothetical protein
MNDESEIIRRDMLLDRKLNVLSGVVILEFACGLGVFAYFLAHLFFSLFLRQVWAIRVWAII